MDKKNSVYKILLSLLFVCSIIFAYYIGKTGMPTILFSYIKKKNIEGNIIDFFGNLIISAGSAIIAYIISNSNIKKQRVEQINKEKVSTNSKLKMLVAELDNNIKTLNTCITTVDDEELIRLADEGLSRDIWSMVYLDIDANRLIIEQIYTAYRQMDLIKTLKPEQLKRDNYKVVKSLFTKLEGLKKEILNFVEENKF